MPIKADVFTSKKLRRPPRTKKQGGRPREKYVSADEPSCHGFGLPMAAP